MLNPIATAATSESVADVAT